MYGRTVCARMIRTVFGKPRADNVRPYSREMNPYIE